MTRPKPLLARRAQKAKSKLKDKFLIFCAVLLSCIPALLHAQQGEPEDVSTKIVSYIIIKGDKLKNVAIRFQVPVRTLKKLNKLKSGTFVVYPGLTLQIPVKVRPKVWDPTKEDISDNGLLSQDRRPSVDYEIITDSFDYDIRDDFVAVSDAVDDSLQFEKVGVHMSKIDKRINLLNYRIDSIKQVEFSFDYQESDINSVLGRMKVARDRYYTNGPLGREIDSLNRIKAKLGNLRVRLRNKITEYEYLMDNAGYSKENYEKEEKGKDTHWGDQITFESNYARSKAKHQELIAEDTATKARVDSIQAAAKAAKAAAALRDSLAAIPKQVAVIKDTVPAPPKPVAVVKDSIVPQPKPVAVVKDITPQPKPVAVAPKPATPAPKPAPVVNNTTPPPKPVAPAPKPVAAAPPVVKPNPTAAKPSPFGLNQKVDIAPLIVKNNQIEIPSRYNRKLELLPSSAIAEKPVSKDVAPAPVSKDVIATAVSIKTDTSVKPAIVVAYIDTTPKITVDTALKTINTVVVRDTIKTVLIVPADTAKKAASVAIAKDSIVKPAMPVVRTIDTTHKAAPVAAAKDTTTKPIAHTIRIDTAHKAIPVIHIKDVTAKPAAPTAVVKPIDKTPKAAVTVHAKDTVAKVAKAVTPVKKPEAAKTTTAKANTSAPDTASEDAATKAAREKNAKKANEIAIKTPKKEPVAKPVTAQDNATKKDTIAKAEPAAPVMEKVEVADISRGTSDPLGYSGRHLKLDTKYDSTMLHREVKINQDPLASYKTDSNFVITNVQLKEIPIIEYKNKPKYLIPVDSLSQIKGEFYLIRARQVLEKGDFKEGDKFLRKSLELNPNNAATWMLHADLCLTTGAVDKALKEYLISGEIDSSNPKVFYNIALLFAKANDEQKAYKYFSKATDVNDKYLLAYMGRASVLMDQRDYEGAIQDYDKTLSINKYYSPAYKGRALAKMEARRFDDAVTDFNQYLEIEDPDGYVLYQRGIAKILSNNLLQGCLDLSSSMELGFKDAEKAIKKFCE
ncbi:MAG: hypothetical protein JWO03_1365 [Bacteroidetes bacterium]|nr:hypothetical protein [Bacteroidota bacterium]